MSDYSLTQEEIDFFHENGYVKPFKVYEVEEAEEMWDEIFLKLISEESKVYSPNKYHYDRHLDIDLLTDHATNPKIIDRLASLMGHDMFLWRTEVFSKSPGDKGTEWHQVESFAYANNKVPQLIQNEKSDWGIVLTVWTAWTESTKENGCLKFQPGSHKIMYFDEQKVFEKKFDYDSTGFYGYTFADLKRDKDWEPKEEDAVYMEMKPGEAVIFTTRCIHGSVPNASSDSRRYSTNARYVKSSTQIFPGMDFVTDHGENYNLEKYASVLVSGEDKFGHNKTVTKNLNGYDFKHRAKNK
ncbi:non-heme Fe2+, alpha-ketoglutarate-dependent halogenase [Pseudoalteromonas citrea]|uniref:Non-heme Fe2+, alpha-ketoglutarate-dependent halogenase n=2 Tax=Pseudoalteromonas citrea TaxID=43655 RepID=A0AAD4AGV0_9GAMM|nr:chlorinating enzyme [Pseudoalteromonas citrea]KAF7768879.1 non-heme Fe2+, alpha-ketoglutarate-dependent halogenase [Pseudoalteromonas citrea]